MDPADTEKERKTEGLLKRGSERKENTEFSGEREREQSKLDLSGETKGMSKYKRQNKRRHNRGPAGV